MAAHEAGFSRISDQHIAAVIRDSDEWAFVEYMIQINTRTSRVKLLQAWHISPLSVVNQFEKRTAEWVTRSSCLTKEKHQASAPRFHQNTIAHICRTVVQRHTVFFDDPEQSKGSSFIRRAEAIRQANRGLSMATAGVLPRHTFRQEYVVYDSSQVVPNYLVLFEVDPTEPELFAVPLCDTCQDFPAAIWCPADTAKLCEACDERLHSYNKLVSRHIRVSLNEVRNLVPPAGTHPPSA
ncbi:Zinc finger protein, related [Eimeria mitis]|uniref:Zinc finger protein, related n=1 Tax=Eimeria mitis TaxID=44415 RepID=U6KAA8_9EIME|nr:Zinc finger protein, related [Eimeria mitis]CDJ32408.1 Zinc finger protein, related [Eimeria mitis]